jgi:hypothetical protein
MSEGKSWLTPKVNTYGEDDGSTVVRESFTQFDKGDEITRERDSVGYSSERVDLLFGRVDIVRV